MKIKKTCIRHKSCSVHVSAFIRHNLVTDTSASVTALTGERFQDSDENRRTLAAPLTIARPP